MATVPKFLMPRDEDVIGPQNEAERRLYKLIMEVINGGQSAKTSIAELTDELRTRIRAKR
jgi:hypothetical protein